MAVVAHCVYYPHGKEWIVDISDKKKEEGGMPKINGAGAVSGGGG